MKHRFRFTYRTPAMLVVMLSALRADGAEKLAWIEPHDIDIPGIVTDARGNPIAGADVEFLLCKLRHGYLMPPIRSRIRAAIGAAGSRSKPRGSISIQIPIGCAPPPMAMR